MTKPGDSLGAYRIVERIGKGSVGLVWRATDSWNKVFAVKQISPENFKERRRRSRFKREALLTRKIAHPSVIRVFEYRTNAPEPYFAMEYFPGGSLRDLLARDPGRIYGNEFFILRQVAEALGHVHSQGIVHCDLKAANVLLGQDGSLRLIDFSMAQTRWDRLFRFGSHPEGTPNYMAPEQVRGGRCDARTDMYALGILAFELLAKRLPFTGGSDRQIAQAHLTLPPPSLRDHVKEASPELDAFIRRLLAKDPADRYEDMQPVLVEITRWAHSGSRIRRYQSRAPELNATPQR